ncbi:MAG TPA: DUF3810 domain-containing protein [Prolixibacteraceae bacterium]|nr:DUF3810 domain-containing protein [Prolixibacteraceae bacterium]
MKQKYSNYLIIFRKKWLIVPILALVTFGLTEVLAANPAFTEKFYSRGIYPYIADVFSQVSAVLPFSLDDIFYVLLLLFAFIVTGLLIFKKVTLKFAGKFVLNVVASVYILFYFLWGFNYYRLGLNQRLDLVTQHPDEQKFLAVFEEIVEQVNNSYVLYDDLNKESIDSLIEQSYKQLAPILQLDYPAGKRIAKDITFSRFFAQSGISGYYGPFFSEVHINSYNLPVEFPFVLAHEKAHQFGVTGEAEANFFAWLVCSASSSKKLNYSANLVAIRYFAYQGYQLENYPEVIGKLEEPVKQDLIRIREHWAQLRNEKIERVASKVNDSYLKTNKVEKGIDDYHGVVKYIMDFKLDTAFRENLKRELDLDF